MTPRVGGAARWHGRYWHLRLPLAGMDFERARAAVLEADGISALVQLEFLHHIAVEGRAGAAEGLTLEHVKGGVQQDAVEVQADCGCNRRREGRSARRSRCWN